MPDFVLTAEQTVMAAVATPTELDFALANFWEFAKIWRNGRKAKLILSCNEGHGQVQLVADLGAADEPHFVRQQVFTKKKTPSQIRREERRRQDRQAEKASELAGNALRAEQAEQTDEAKENPTDAEEAVEGLNDTAAGIAVKLSGNSRVMVINSTKEADVGELPKEVFDKVCSDEAFKEKIAENLNTEKGKPRELAAVQGVRVETLPGEKILEVRPQYCKFSEHELANKLSLMGFELVCLPWVANTGRHYYTAGFKVSEESYERFKTKEGGKMPKGFYTVEVSSKLN